MPVLAFCDLTLNLGKVTNAYAHGTVTFMRQHRAAYDAVTRLWVLCCR